ncbi:MAG: OmpA family protein, partial [Leptospira sp.]|nr:OmpA family protein [Leptospira sp.]
PSFEGMFSIRFDSSGKPVEIYFTGVYDKNYDRDGYEGLNIYHTKKNPRTDKWTTPKHIDELNSNFNDKMPAISPDGKTLVFSSDRPGGLGGYDLWKSTREEATGTWSKPINMGTGINSSANEIMPAYHYDGLTLYFSSNRNDENNKYNFYGSDFSENRFGDIYDLKKPFNSPDDDEGISLTHDGLWAYYSSNRIGGEGQFDIYRTQVPEDLRRAYEFEFSGLVLDGSETTMIGLDSTLKIYDATRPVSVITSKRIGGDLTGKDAKNFSTILKTGKFYKVEVSSPGFHPTELHIDLRGNVGLGKSQYSKIVLMPVMEDKSKSTEINTDKSKDPKIDTNATDGSLKIHIKDFDTKKYIEDSSLKLFTEEKKDGILFTPKKGIIILDKIPSIDFEVLAFAKDYKEETVSLRKDTKEKDLTIFLRAKNSLDPIYGERIYFNFNEYKLTAGQAMILDRVSGFLKKNTKDRLEIGGHTDNVAGKEFNVKLSQRRAEEIRKYFQKKGIESKRIETRAYWYSQPEADNNTEAGRAKNRRASFKKLE